MAAIDLSGKNVKPTILNQAGIGTTWQEFILPPWARFISISGDAGIFVAFHDAADSGAVGATPKMSQGGGVQVEYKLSPSINSASSAFVAAQAGTTDVDIILEG